MRSPRLFSFLGNQSNRPRQGQTSVLFYRFNHYDYRCKTPKTGGPVSEKNSSRNCLINSWRALSTLVLSDTRRPNRAPSHRSTPWWDPRIGPVSIYQTVSEGFFSETAFKIALPSFYFTAVTVRRGTISVDGVQNFPAYTRIPVRYRGVGKRA